MPNGNDIEKKEFGRRLYQLLRDKDLSQSDVAEKLFGREDDSRGRSVASKRDLVSKWVRGVAFPGPKNLHRLAKVLDMEVSGLAPGHGQPSVDKRLPDFQMKQQGDQIVLVVNQVVRPDQALRIMAILQEKEKK